MTRLLFRALLALGLLCLAPVAHADSVGNFVTCVNTYIKTNGQQQITAQALNNCLNLAATAMQDAQTPRNGQFNYAQLPAIPGATPGTYGSATQSPVVTLNAQGYVTSITPTTITALANQLQGTTLAPNVTASSLTTLGPNAAYGNLTPNQLDASVMFQSPQGYLRGNAAGANPGNVTDSPLTAYMDAAFGPTQGQIICRGLSGWGPIAAGITAGYALTANGAGVCPSYQSPSAVGAAAPRSSVRQIVQAGPSVAGTATTAATVPSFLAATSASLTPVFQNISTAVPLIFSAAQGNNAAGNQDLVYQYTAPPTAPAMIGSQTISGVSCTTTVCTITTSAAHNLVVGSTVAPSGCSSAFLNISTAAPYGSDSYFKVATVPSSTTFTVNTPNPQTGTAFAAATPTGCAYTVQNFLFANAQGGAISSSLLVPIQDQCGGAVSSTAGQFTFDKCGGATGVLGTNATLPMVGYLAGASTPLVALGECAASATTLSGCLGYAYNGYAEGTPSSAVPPTAAFTTWQLNLGVNGPTKIDINVIAPTAGYSVGDKIDNFFVYNGTLYSNSYITSSKYYAGFGAGATAPNIYYNTKTTANYTSFTTANTLLYKPIQRRGWGGAYLLNRDLNPANDNRPVGLNAAA